MTTELVPVTNANWVSTLAPAAELAKQIAGTEFVPASMRNQAAKVTACILFGQELGIGPMQSLAKVDIIDGRPAPKAELARALVLAAGHEMILKEATNTKATIAGRRKGSQEWQTVTWTMDDAKRAGLDSKQNWRKWPRQMLVARASAELARTAFADCLGGVSLFAEELEDDAAPEVTVTTEHVVKADTGRKRKLTPVAATVAPVADLPPLPHELEAADNIIDAEIITGAEPHVEGRTEQQTPADTPDGITLPQLKKLLVLFDHAQIANRDDRLRLVNDLIGRPVKTSKELTKDEASTVIDRLMAVEDGRATLAYTDHFEIIDDGPDAA